MRVTADQIRAALKACGGNIAQAAVILGIARNNLYKRLSSLNLNPDDYRSGAGNVTHGAPVTADAHAAGAEVSAPRVNANAGASRAPQSFSAILPGSHGTRILTRVNHVAAADAPEIEGPKRLRQSRSFYFRPDHVQAIEEACLDLPAILREPMSPSKVMERFLDDCFKGWLARMKKQPPKRRSRKEE